MMPVTVHRPEHAAADHKRPFDHRVDICGLHSGVFITVTRPAGFIEAGQPIECSATRLSFQRAVPRSAASSYKQSACCMCAISLATHARELRQSTPM